MGHGDAAQQDAVPQGGPMGPTRALATDELQYTFTCPGFFGINTSGVYADGRIHYGTPWGRVRLLPQAGPE